MKLYGMLLFFFFFMISQLSSDETCLYLTSREDVGQRFIERVQEEKEQILLASHRLSHSGVIEALIEAHRRNVRVEVIVDSVSVSKNSCLQRLIREGIFVSVWQSQGFPVPIPSEYPGIPPGIPKPKPRFQRRMNHSFCVFGSDLAWTGSYAFGVKSKFPNFENAILVRDEKVAKEFLEEFEKMKKKHAIYLPLYLEQKELKS
jgi:phosphatidylserine/phosphatidylglycerophosphate/cardiolipin synthase-like enzyme